MASTSDSTQKSAIEITIDQECWLENRLRKAISMTLVLREKCTNGSDQLVFEKAFEGILDGTIEEILKIFNLKRKE